MVLADITKIDAAMVSAAVRSVNDRIRMQREATPLVRVLAQSPEMMVVLEAYADKLDANEALDFASVAGLISVGIQLGHEIALQQIQRTAQA